MKLTDRQLTLLQHTFLDYQSNAEFIDNPLIVQRADGLYYWDVEGKPYFDAIGGIFVATLGHRHPRVMEALRRQLDRVTFAPPMHGTADVTLDFVERLGAVAPGPLRFVKSFSGGSESIEAALKFARQYFKQTGRPGKHKFISRYLGYHGGTFGAMAASGTGRRKTPFEPHASGFVKVFPPSHYRDRFDSWEEANRFAAQSVEDVILHEDPDTVAAFIVEPIGNTGGIITPTAEYFQMLRAICDRYDVLLIFDEIITGYGRTGAMFAAQAYGVTPDIICGGKGLSSGALPLGAMIASETLAAAFQGRPEDDVHFAHGHTYAGNPLGCAVGIAVLDEIETQRLDAHAAEMGEHLAARLQRLERFGVVREVRGKGLIRGVELVRDTRSMAPFPELGRMLKRTALEQGLVMRIDPNWFAVAPALIAQREDIDIMGDLIEASLAAALDRVNSA